MKEEYAAYVSNLQPITLEEANSSDEIDAGEFAGRACHVK